MKKGILIKANGEMEWRVPKDRRSFTLEELQGFVGGYIELVRLPGELDLYCNEEGLLRSLPFNPIASVLCSEGLGVPMNIVGDVIMGEFDPVGETRAAEAEEAAP